MGQFVPPLTLEAEREARSAKAPSVADHLTMNAVDRAEQKTEIELCRGRLMRARLARRERQRKAAERELAAKVDELRQEVPEAGAVQPHARRRAWIVRSVDAGAARASEKAAGEGQGQGRG